MTIHILLVEDHPVVRAGLSLTLRTLDDDVRIIEAATVKNALDLLGAKRSLALIVYDWYLPDGGGHLGLMAVQELAPSVPVVVISGTPEEAVRRLALQLGAKAYVPKSDEPAAMRSVFLQVLGAMPAMPGLSNGTAGRAEGPSGLLIDAAIRVLTGRQNEVLLLLAKGHPDKLIAKTLGIANATVRAHVSEILSALHAHNRTAAVMIAAERGLIPPPPAQRLGG